MFSVELTCDSGHTVACTSEVCSNYCGSQWQYLSTYSGSLNSWGFPWDSPCRHSLWTARCSYLTTATNQIADLSQLCSRLSLALIIHVLVLELDLRRFPRDSPWTHPTVHKLSDSYLLNIVILATRFQLAHKG